MALFENYEGRMPQLQPVLDKYGFASWEDLKKFNNEHGVDGYGITEGIQPICFENAVWAYMMGTAIAAKRIYLLDVELQHVKKTMDRILYMMYFTAGLLAVEFGVVVW